MKKIHPLLLSALSGLLLFAAWPVSPLTFLIFVAFVPLLWLEQQATRGTQFFASTYLTLLIWNGAATWWVCNSTLPGGISAILANSLLMSIPWIGFRKIKRRMGPTVGYAALILFWLSFEYVHLNWELSWPWLTLGNVFATHPGWVQWYELTGTSGGSLWVLVVNLLFFLLLQELSGEKLPRSTTYPAPQPVILSASAYPPSSRTRRLSKRHLVFLILLVIIPLVVSRLLTPAPVDDPAIGLAGAPGISPHNIVIVQPDIDPYQKFAPGNREDELHKLIRLSESQIDSQTSLVVWPETAVPEQIDEEGMSTNPLMAPVWNFLRRYPAVDLLTGMEGFRVFSAANKTPYSEKIPDRDEYADSYNSAVLLDTNSAQIYHKSKLVPGPETLPSFLKFMTPLFEKFGGTTGGYARQDERTVLLTPNHTYRIAPSVCYESIYGEFMSAYVRNGADLLVVITNDGWWGKSPGFRQHENYARLRAIETRRWIARSANTGISCFINPSGKVIDPQPWDTTAAIKMTVPPSEVLTFFVRHGDILSRLAIALTILLIGWWLLILILKRKPRHG